LSLLRHALAWILVVLLPPAILYWFAVHPLAPFWRRVGGWAGLAAGFATLIASAIGLASVAPRLLVREYGFSWPLTAVALVLIVAAAVIQRRRKKYLTFRVLMGVPELTKEPAESRLFTEGIYSRIRHPRYVEVVLATTGYALVANYLAAYVVLAISIGLIYLLVLVEERELHARFGRAWEEYAARTPRFLPAGRR
jgi:protein-S-isoprenylcysteine O-methyltransferase Ste14